MSHHQWDTEPFPEFDPNYLPSTGLRPHNPWGSLVRSPCFETQWAKFMGGGPVTGRMMEEHWALVPRPSPKAPKSTLESEIPSPGSLVSMNGVC